MTHSTQTVTLPLLAQMKKEGHKIPVLTAYDASFARILDESGVDIVLVGDSLGMVIQGRDSTLPVTVDHMVYHASHVSAAINRAMVMVDMPFMSFRTPELALENAGRLMQEGGAHMVKLEGGAEFVNTVQRLSSHGIPVCAHLGLMPQSVHKSGGYRVQGRERHSAQTILHDAQAMQDAGADMLLLECVPASLARDVSRTLTIPVIGIGAGPDCDAQVLVLYDILGLSHGIKPKFSVDFLQGKNSIAEAVSAYVLAVRELRYPGPEHCY